MYGKMAARTLYPGLPQSCSYTRAPIDAILMDIAFKYQYITIIVLAHHLGRLLQCREVRKKSAKATLPIPERLVQGCLHHRILWVPFLLHGDDSVMASYLRTSSSASFTARWSAPGGLLRSAGSLPLVIIRAKQAPSRESSVRGVGPGLVHGDVVDARDDEPLLPGVAHLVHEAVAELVLDLHAAVVEHHLGVVVLAQAVFVHYCRNSFVSTIRRDIDSSFIIKFY